MNDKYCVAVFGGAVAGSEAVEQMTQNGVHVILFEQNAIPYGKIESGLPKWHIKLRDRQEEKIDTKLDQEQVHYIPNCKLGDDIDFNDVAQEWDLNAVLLATGAWKDRPLPVPGIENYIGKGFYYQNAFVQWFNQMHDPAYSGASFDIQENAVIIGGGLASIDVAKILMIETFRKAIQKIGKDLDTITIERIGLPAAAEKLEVNLDELNLKPCRIYYRRRIVDMPLSPAPVTAEPQEIQKAQSVREKIVKLAQNKFLFKLIDCHGPKELIIEEGQLKGMVMQKHKVENDKLITIAGALEKVYTPLIISSIGSLPEPIPGIKTIGEKFDLADAQSGKLSGFDNVFALGNAITGKGNIKESQKHGRRVSEAIIRDYLGVFGKDEHSSDYDFKTDIAEQMEPVNRFIKDSKPVSEAAFNSIMKKVKELQVKAGYTNDYKAWIKAHLPLRLENITG